MKKHSWLFGVLYGRKKAKRVKKDTKRGEVDGKKNESKKSALILLKEPYFYLMIFLWLFAFCLAVYAVLIGAIVPY
ncbi:MAG: hypothetical protein H8D34_26370 [Chloroflexi bacterium]|nr:hypothetical protein [Chloroflexota bacterium]